MAALRPNVDLRSFPRLPRRFRAAIWVANATRKEYDGPEADSSEKRYMILVNNRLKHYLCGHGKTA